MSDASLGELKCQVVTAGKVFYGNICNAHDVIRINAHKSLFYSNTKIYLFISVYCNIVKYIQYRSKDWGFFMFLKVFQVSYDH